MDVRKELLRQTGVVALGEALGVAAMMGIFALLGKFDMSVLWGGIVGGLVAIANFFVMAIGVNIAADKAEKVVLDIAGMDAKNVTARILTGKIDAKNTFEDQHAVEIADFADFTVTAEGIEMNLPACSVVEVTVRG